MISSAPFATTTTPDLRELQPHEFGMLIEPHRSELRAHCYRFLGSLLDAEDLVQETFLRAWRRRETFGGRGSVRGWLYQIATNLCLDHQKQRPRRTIPKVQRPHSDPAHPIPPAPSEPIWLEPLPDAYMPTGEHDPEATYSLRESVSLAFMVILQTLPPRQRAVLLLRDVLNWQADEVAELLETSVASVKSALYRARVTLAESYHKVDSADAPQPLLNASTQEWMARYLAAWHMGDPDQLVALLKEDASFSMPPIPTWYQGRTAIRTLVAKTIFAGAAQGRWRLVLTTPANGQVAFALYRLGEDGKLHGYGIQLLTFAGNEIADILTFRVPALIKHWGVAEVI